VAEKVDGVDENEAHKHYLGARPRPPAPAAPPAGCRYGHPPTLGRRPARRPACRPGRATRSGCPTPTAQGSDRARAPRRAADLDTVPYALLEEAREYARFATAVYCVQPFRDPNEPDPPPGPRPCPACGRDTRRGGHDGGGETATRNPGRRQSGGPGELAAADDAGVGPGADGHGDAAEKEPGRVDTDGKGEKVGCCGGGCGTRNKTPSEAAVRASIAEIGHCEPGDVLYMSPSNEVLAHLPYMVALHRRAPRCPTGGAPPPAQAGSRPSRRGAPGTRPHSGGRRDAACTARACAQLRRRLNLQLWRAGRASVDQTCAQEAARGRGGHPRHKQPGGSGHRRCRAPRGDRRLAAARPGQGARPSAALCSALAPPRRSVPA